LTERIVIVGAGHAAGEMCVALRHDGFAGPITLIGDEPHLPYQRPPLSKAYLKGEMELERLLVRPAEFYDDNNIELRLGVRAVAIDRTGSEVKLADGSSVPYDKLALLTGTRARELPVPGADLAGVHYVRTIRDIDGFLASFEYGDRLAVVGGGYIGLEIAASASKYGLKATVVERMPRLLARVATEQTAAKIHKLHADRGADILLDAALERMTGDGRVQSLELADGKPIETDVVIVGIGVVPNQELAAEAGLETGNGIIVDEYCRTSDPNIFAAGDVAEHPNKVFGRVRLESVQNAVQQAKVCALNMLGKQVPYVAVPWFWSDQFEVRMQSAGLPQNFDQIVERPGKNDYSGSNWLFRNGQLIAVEALSEPKSYMLGKRWLEQGKTPEPERLANPDEDLKKLV